jgi:hypothetical protein
MAKQNWLKWQNKNGCDGKTEMAEVAKQKWLRWQNKKWLRWRFHGRKGFFIAKDVSKTWHQLTKRELT